MGSRFDEPHQPPAWHTSALSRRQHFSNARLIMTLHAHGSHKAPKSPRCLAGHRGVSEAIPHHTYGMGGDFLWFDHAHHETPSPRDSVSKPYRRTETTLSTRSWLRSQLPSARTPCRCWSLRSTGTRHGTAHSGRHGSRIRPTCTARCWSSRRSSDTRSCHPH